MDGLPHSTLIASVALALVAPSCAPSSSSKDGAGTAGPEPGHSVVYRLEGLNFSPYLAGQDPNRGVAVSETQVRDRMRVISKHTNRIRTFGTLDGLEHAGAIAHEFGLMAVIGAWISSNPASNADQIDSLVAMANKGETELVVVGSEVILRGDLSVTEVIELINQVRTRVPASVSVGYADVYSVLNQNPDLVSAVDVVLSNHYPYWEGVELSQAVRELSFQYRQLVAVAGGRKVIISETGWPSAGNAVGAAVPSPLNAAAYFLEFVSWARANDVTYYYFSAFDEAWKAQSEGPQGAHWGIWDENGIMKGGMEAVFTGVTVTGEWATQSIPGGPGTPEIRFTFVPAVGSHEDLRGQVLHVAPAEYRVLVYIRVRGRWWTKPTFAQPFTSIASSGTWVTDITTGGVDPEATEVAAFLVPATATAPLASGLSAIPPGAAGLAVASVTQTR